jgi:glycosyltransferase involved in cell wall biosynthesis
MLLLGPLPPPMGGDTRHFSTLVADLRADRRFQVTVINTSRGREHSRVLRNAVVAVGIVLRVVIRLHRVDLVSYHSSDRGMLLFGPFVVMLAAIARKPVVLRLFGGSFGDFYDSRSWLGRLVIRRFILCADVVLLQTRRLVGQLGPHASGQVVWFSTYIARTCAPPPEALPAPDQPCRRFVFLGHLWRSKGIETLLEAAPHVAQGCSIDLYGSLDEYSKDDIDSRGLGRVRYRGFLTHEEVDVALWSYDCLVLPTWHSGEGYPGVIAEAFAHALPVITTRWMAIPEIVDESCGILIAPHDTSAFVSAINALHDDPAYWGALKRGAALRAQQFDHAFWSARFKEVCESLLGP